MEDRGAGVGGCYNVMHVVMNRVKSPDFPNTVKGVVFQKNAFSWTRDTDPQFGLVPKPTDAIYLAALEAARFVLAGDSDPTGGALWYCNPKTITAGGWFQKNILDHPEKHPFLVRIGKHCYYA